MGKHSPSIFVMLSICLFTIGCQALRPQSDDMPPIPAAAGDMVIPDIVITPTIRLPMKKLMDAVMDAATTCDWTPEAVSPNCVRCDLIFQNKRRIVVDVFLMPDKIIFRYVNSENMRYDPVKKSIHRKYNEQVRTLGMQINREIIKRGAR